MLTTSYCDVFPGGLLRWTSNRPFIKYFTDNKTCESFIILKKMDEDCLSLIFFKVFWHDTTPL